VETLFEKSCIRPRITRLTDNVLQDDCYRLQQDLEQWALHLARRLLVSLKAVQKILSCPAAL